jgi:hypothetical protein
VGGFTVAPAALDTYAKALNDSGTGGLDAKYLIDASNYANGSARLESGRRCQGSTS